jgi:hypothetical protein
MASFASESSVLIDLRDHCRMRLISGFRIGFAEAFAFCTGASERFSSRLSQRRHVTSRSVKLRETLQM